jgi:hypothetical protein
MFSRESMEHSVLMSTQYRTKHLEEMTDKEFESLYFSFFPNEKPHDTNYRIQQLERERELKRLRSIILTDADYMGIYKVGDWTRFNHFMLTKSPLKKSLNKYKVSEFPELIKQFKSMRYRFDKSKTKVGSSAWFHLFGFPPSNN